MPRNLLLEEVEYHVQETAWGIWKSFMYPNGRVYREFTSHTKYGESWPLIHITQGICPETGRRKIARGVLAIGRLAVGGIAIGQASAGVVGIGQASIGIVLGLGQATAGIVALGQVAISAALGLGQLAVGHVAIGQLAAGHYALGQLAVGQFVWSPKVAMPEAVEFFKSLVSW